jgi:hypothetical protein
MQNIGPYLVGAAFWLFIGAVAIAGMITEYKRRRIGIEVLRMAVEKGQQLDPEMVEKLMSCEHRAARIDPLDLKLGGIITIASGFGLCPLAYFISRVAPIAFYPIVGTGALAVFVGAGLLFGARTLAEARERESPRNPST